MAQVAQLATTAWANIISIALAVQIVPLTSKMKLVAQVVVDSCATCATAQTSLVPDTHSYLLDFFALVVPLFWACCAQYLVSIAVAQYIFSASCANCVTNWQNENSGTSGCR